MDKLEHWATIGVGLRRVHAHLEALLRDEDLDGELRHQLGKAAAATDLTLHEWHKVERLLPHGQ